MPSTTVPTTPAAVTAAASVAGLDRTSVVEYIDRAAGIVAIRLHGARGGVVIEGPVNDIYRLVLDLDRQLGQMIGGDR